MQAEAGAAPAGHPPVDGVEAQDVLANDVQRGGPSRGGERLWRRLGVALPQQPCGECWPGRWHGSGQDAQP